MRGSERGGSGFIVASTCSLFLTFAAVGCLNYRVDPNNVFRAQQPPVTQTSLTYYIAFGERAWELRSMALQASDSRPSVLLVGASQLLYGMDVCAIPSISRLALFELNDGEARKIIEAAAATQHKPLTYLISVGQSGNAEQLPNPRKIASKWHNLFSWGVTKISLSSYASRFTPHRSCGALPFPAFEDMSPTGVAQRLSRAENHGYSVADVAGSLSAIGASCSQWPNRVVVFTLPVYFRREDVGRLRTLEGDRTVQISSAIRSFNRSYPKCHAAFDDVATAYTREHASQGAIENDWIDGTHFAPSLGKRILNSILSVGQEER